MMYRKRIVLILGMMWDELPLVKPDATIARHSETGFHPQGRAWGVRYVVRIICGPEDTEPTTEAD